MTQPPTPLASGSTDGEGATVGAALTDAHKGAIFSVFSTFYKELTGRWNTTVLANIWEGPNAVMVNQLSASPMRPPVAQSLISMLATITQAKPEPNLEILARSGALEALYGIAFNGQARLDLLDFAALPKTTLTPAEQQHALRCCISLRERDAIEEPVLIRGPAGVHLFEWATLKGAWREGFKFINPMTRQVVRTEQLMALATP
jgi:hypothetical protein